MEKLSVIKIGGNIVDNESALEKFLQDFKKLEGKKILVHGGGVMASKMSHQLGIETKMIEGRRITDEATLKVVTMVYAGWINKQIVAELQKLNCNAIGLSGADGNVIPSKKRNPVPLDYGFVGDPVTGSINTAFISQLLDANIVPVFCAITHDENGSLLNTNADTIAYSLATAMSSQFITALYYCFEKEGVMKNVEDPHSLIPFISKTESEDYKRQGIIVGGMIPKIDNSFKAIENGVSEVLILHARNLLSKKGTLLK